MNRPVPWSAVALFAFSSLSLLACWSMAVLMLTSGILAQPEQTPFPIETASIFMRAAGLFLAGILLIPAALFSLCRIMDKPLPRWGFLSQASPAASRSPLPWVLLLLWPVSLLVGQWAATQTRWDWLLLPPLYLLAIALPVWWLVEVGRRGLPAGDPHRTWGIFSLGLVAGPVLAISLELLAIGLLAGLIGILIAINPEWSAEVTSLATRIMSSGANPEILGRILQPYLMRPGVLYLIMVMVSGIVPLIEELVKPIGVWMLAKRGITPTEGFVAGLLSGTGFALFESLSMSSNLTGMEWAGLAAARAGTDLLHITTTGLMGWALVSAWREQRYLRLGAIYLITVSIHGLWNMLSIMMVLNEYSEFAPPNWGFLFERLQLAPVGMAALLITLFVLLFGANRRLRKNLPQSAPTTNPSLSTGD